MKGVCLRCINDLCQAYLLLVTSFEINSACNLNAGPSSQPTQQTEVVDQLKEERFCVVEMDSLDQKDF